MTGESHINNTVNDLNAANSLKPKLLLIGKLIGLLSVGTIAGICLSAAIIHLRLNRVAAIVPEPQIIVVLGGEPEREQAAAAVAKRHPDMEIWISSRRPQRIIYRRLEEAGIKSDHITIDSRATDTLENFTTLVAPLQAANIRHVYLVTAGYHMRRSQAIAFWVWGAHNIRWTPVTVESVMLTKPSDDRVSDSSTQHTDSDIDDIADDDIADDDSANENSSNDELERFWKIPRDVVRSWAWLILNSSD